MRRPGNGFWAMALYNVGQTKTTISELLVLLADSSGDPGVTRYRRAIRLYAADLDRTWP